MPVLEARVRDWTSGKIPSCLEEVAARLYECSDAASYSYRILSAEEAFDEDIEEALCSVKTIAGELETLADWLYSLTAQGVIAQRTADEPIPYRTTGGADELPF